MFCVSIPSQRTTDLSTRDRSNVITIRSLLRLVLLGLQALALDATRSADTQRACQREINVLLGLQTNHERRDVDHALANAETTQACEMSVHPHRTDDTRVKAQACV